MKINAIAAVGTYGEIGNNGRMPWPKDPEDLEFFRSSTEGHVVLFGGTTFDALFDTQPVWKNRLILRMGYEKTAIYDEGNLVGYWSPGVEPIIAQLDPKPITLWVAGGAQIFELWKPYIRRWFISSIIYGGPADVYMPQLWRSRDVPDA